MDNMLSNFKRVNKWHLVPPDWKADVDGSLLKVLSLNRGFIKNLDNEVRNMSTQSPERFLEGLISSWNNHNTFFSSIHDFLVSLPERGNMAPKQLEHTQIILEDMGLVDRVTLLYSLTIKPLLETNKKVGFAPFNSFYNDYPLDHHRLICGEISLEEIIQKYHGGSIELFEQRKNKGLLLNIFSGGVNKRELKELRVLREKMFLKALYDFFIDRHDRVKSLVKICTIDNFDEYRFLYNLEGIEGFYLKDYLIRKGLLEEPKQGVGRLLNYLDSLKIKMNKTSSGQEINFGVIPFYVQSTGVSCASTCAMMATHLFYKEPISKEREDKFHSLMKSDFLGGCPFSKVAEVLSKLYPSLNLSLYHTNPSLFNEEVVGNLFGGEGVLATREYLRYAKKAEKNGVGVKIQKDLIETINRTINERGIYIAATYLGGGILHSELVMGRDGRKLQVYDPLRGFPTLVEISEFAKKMKTPIGEWGIALASNFPDESLEYRSSIDEFRRKEEELKSDGLILNKLGRLK